MHLIEPQACVIILYNTVVDLGYQRKRVSRSCAIVVCGHAHLVNCTFLIIIVTVQKRKGS